MKIPARLQPLVDDGLISEVISRLMSGKEADVYVVRTGESYKCAKVYKEALKRSFKKASQYNEGRKVRNSRRARAMEKGSKYGRQQQEMVWQTAEVDALRKAAMAGVRVPDTYGCTDGVLLMELITDEEGYVAPRLAEITMSEEQALEDHALMMDYVKRMLTVGMVHGDLSEFNVLVDDYGPVIIDLPQAVDAAANNHAKRMLDRDVQNITDYYALFAPTLRHTHYSDEMWQHFENGTLTEATELTGEFEYNDTSADVGAVLDEIKAILAEEEDRKQRLREANDDDN